MEIIQVLCKISLLYRHSLGSSRTIFTFLDLIQGFTVNFNEEEKLCLSFNFVTRYPAARDRAE